MSEPTFFIDRIEQKLGEPLSALPNFVDSRLNSARPCEVVTILRSDALQDVDADLRSLVEEVTPAEMLAMKLQLPAANLQIVEGAVTAAILDAEKAHHGRIAIKTRTGYQRIFFKGLVSESEVRLLAAGADASLVLDSVKKSIQSFDITRFDSDGFLITRS